MATIKLTINVSNVDDVLLQYDQIKVYRSATEAGVYAEISGVGTRPELVSGQSEYEFLDTTAPSPLAWYKTSYYDSVGDVESDLSSAKQGSDPGLYVTLQDIRDEGYDDDDISDDRALVLSYGWQNWIEHMTGQWFSPKELTFDIDGNGSRVLWLNVPIISLTSLYINDDFTNELDSSYYTVYNRIRPEDDRKNPRIKLKRQSSSIFSSGSNRVFQTGDLNQRLIGTFGYVEEDGSTPFIVKRAILTLIALTMDLKSDSEIDELSSGRRIEEVTDRHRVRFANLYNEIQAWKPTGLTDVDNVLQSMRKPAFVGSPRSFNL